MAPQDVYHNSEAQQQTASVNWAHLSCKNLEGLIKTPSLALTTDAINVSLTCAECFPICLPAFGRHIIGQRDGEATAFSRLGFNDVCCPWVRVEHVWTDDKGIVSVGLMSSWDSSTSQPPPLPQRVLNPTQFADRAWGILSYCLCCCFHREHLQTSILMLTRWWFDILKSVFQCAG